MLNHDSKESGMGDIGGQGASALPLSSGMPVAVALDRSTQEQHEHEMVRKAAIASFLGNFIEWFDYASYSYLATVIALVFFPSSNPRVALLEAFGVFALSFLLRPIGAVVWGNWGDKKGRRWALSVSILLMAGSSFLIGCLPDYQTIGLLAPLSLLVLRMVQGFSASGEYAGAATFLAEYAPVKKRGIYVSLVPASTAVGLLVGSMLAAGLFAALTPAQMQSWGWRILFWVAGPLGLVTCYIRNHLEDSPVYTEMLEKAKQKQESPARPLHELWFRHRKALAISFGVATLNAVGFYLVLTYLPTYLTAELKISSSKANLASTIALVFYVFSIFVMGYLSDHIGRKRMLLAACIGFVVFTVPAFMFLGSAGFIGIVVVEIVLCLLLTINDGTMASYLTETFPTSVRYTGFAISMNMANTIFGGTASFIATWLIGLTHSPVAPAWYVVVVALGALLAMLASHENTGKDLRNL